MAEKKANIKTPILFARRDSVYKAIDGCDVWDADRDATKWAGGRSGVFHPPCRGWGSLAHLAKPAQGEKELAVWSVDQIRKSGGVLEHPRKSRLWPAMNLPRAGEFDSFGGFTFPVLQQWFGHKAEKPTNLYILGIRPVELPVMPFVLGEASHVICNYSVRYRTGSKPRRPEVSKKLREATPLAFAVWLVEVARRCDVAMCRGNQTQLDQGVA